MIPYGTKYTVKVSGSIWKPVTCENCRCEYAYQIKHETSGAATNLLWLNKDGAIRNAENNANQNLESYLMNSVRNYHCPDCGFYQTDMIHRMKNSIWQRTIILGIVAFVIVAFATASNASSMFYSITAGLIVTIAFLSPLRNFNPNVNANSRINQEFSESYPVTKREKELPILADVDIESIKPFAIELFHRVSAGEEMEIVAKSIAKRANVNPEQVMTFAFALVQAMKEKNNELKMFDLNNIKTDSNEKDYDSTKKIENQKEKTEQTKKAVTPKKALSEKKDRPYRQIAGIKVCPKCQMKVIPKSDGACPSCQSEII